MIGAVASCRGESGFREFGVWEFIVSGLLLFHAANAKERRSQRRI
jgi:hypothetical protein